MFHKIVLNTDGTVFFIKLKKSNPYKVSLKTVQKIVSYNLNNPQHFLFQEDTSGINDTLSYHPGILHSNLKNGVLA